MEQAERRDAAEKAILVTALGIEEERRIPSALRSQLRQLEEDQKRRVRRSQTDEASVTDLINVDRSEEVQRWAGGATPTDP